MTCFQALLISRLPNLAHLMIDYQDLGNFEAVSSIFRQALCFDPATMGLPQYHYLERVDLYSGDIDKDSGGVGDCTYRRETAQLLPFLYLPSLRELNTEMFMDDGPIRWPSTPPCAIA